MTEGVDGLLRDKTRPPGIPKTPDDKVAEVLRLTQEPPPHEATHWTIRAMGRAVGLAASTVRGIWKSHGLCPHRWRQVKLSNDRAFVEKLHDVAGFYSAVDSGCSGTSMRIALTERYLAHFPAKTIRLLLAGRAFVGADRMEFLCKSNVPFAIRMRDTLRIPGEDRHDLTLRARLRQARRGRSFCARLGTREDVAEGDGPLLNVAAKPRKGDSLIVVTNVAPRTVIRICRKRRAIECLLRRCQDPRPRSRGHAPHRPTQAQLAHVSHSPRSRLGRTGRRGPAWQICTAAQKPWPLCQILVSKRLRPHPKSAQIRSSRCNRTMAADNAKTAKIRPNRVVCEAVSSSLHYVAILRLSRRGGEDRSAWAAVIRRTTGRESAL